MSVDANLLAALKAKDFGELQDVVAALPDAIVQALLNDLGGTSNIGLPPSPLAQALELDEGYVERPHLVHLSERLTAAVTDVRAGRNRRIVVSMPPRMGKSQLASVYLPVWLLRLNPRWKIGLISHDPTLATGWGRAVRGLIEQNPDLGLSIAPDAGAASEWQTTERGGITSRSAPGQSITGRGFNIMLVDDVVKDFAAAHSEAARKAIWAWWTANAETRLEPPSLVVVIGTRWHEDDFIGRLLSTEYDGDPADWEVISFPALAEQDDVLGRAPGDPLLSPLIRQETPAGALERWATTRRSVGGYSWAALFQQRPAPAEGSIFNIDWWRFWTHDPERATPDGKVRYLDPDNALGARWLDSWDMAFKGADDSDYVVGQRWLRQGANRFLIDQRRGRWSFTQTIQMMKDFATALYGRHVHERLVEEKANGAAIIDTLHDVISGLKPVNPSVGKEARARAITPEIESGNVYLPHPAEAPWVLDLLAEVRSFPSGANDDMVDTLTQALSGLREGQGGTHITIPGERATDPRVDRDIASAARTSIRRTPAG